MTMFAERPFNSLTSVPMTSSSLMEEVVSIHNNWRVCEKQVFNVLTYRVQSPPAIVWQHLSDFGGSEKWRPLAVASKQLSEHVEVGARRKMIYTSGLPGSWQLERLDVHDKERHLFGYSILDGDFHITGFSTLFSLHDDPDDKLHASTLVVQSYVVTLPAGVSREDMRVIYDRLNEKNLEGLAAVSMKHMITLLLSDSKRLSISPPISSQNSISSGDF